MQKCTCCNWWTWSAFWCPRVMLHRRCSEETDQHSAAAFLGWHVTMFLCGWWHVACSGNNCLVLAKIFEFRITTEGFIVVIVCWCRACLRKWSQWVLHQSPLAGRPLSLTWSHRRYCLISMMTVSLPCAYSFPALGGHFGIARSVRLSIPWRSCLGCRHAGCLQLSHCQPSPEMCGLRTRPQTDVGLDLPRFLNRTAISGGGISSRPPPGR